MKHASTLTLLTRLKAWRRERGRSEFPQDTVEKTILALETELKRRDAFDLDKQESK